MAQALDPIDTLLAQFRRRSSSTPSPCSILWSNSGETNPNYCSSCATCWASCVNISRRPCQRSPRRTTQPDPLRTWTIDAGVGQHSRAPLDSPRVVWYACSTKAAPRLRSMRFSSNGINIWSCACPPSHRPTHTEHHWSPAGITSRGVWRCTVASALATLNIQSAPVRPRADQERFRVSGRLDDRSGSRARRRGNGRSLPGGRRIQCADGEADRLTRRAPFIRTDLRHVNLGLVAQRPKRVRFTGCMVFDHLIDIYLREYTTRHPEIAHVVKILQKALCSGQLPTSLGQVQPSGPGITVNVKQKLKQPVVDRFGIQLISEITLLIGQCEDGETCRPVVLRNGGLGSIHITCSHTLCLRLVMLVQPLLQLRAALCQFGGNCRGLPHALQASICRCTAISSSL